AACFQIILLLDAAPGDGFADGDAMLRLDERDIVDDEDPGFLNRSEFIRGRFGRLDSITPTVKRPGAAKGAIPGAAPAELDRGARIKNPDEVFRAMSKGTGGGAEFIQVATKCRWRPSSRLRDNPWHLEQFEAITIRHRLNKPRDRGFPFPFHHAI